jgi:signal transduction histidine kinase/CBS domain-containing protein
MFTLKDIKTTKTITIDYRNSLKEALGIINYNQSGCVVILNDNKAVGIITESDIIKALERKTSLKEQAFSIATTNLIETDENRSVEFAFEILNQYNIKRLLLKDEDGLYKGIVLQEDLIRYLESDFYKVDLKIHNLIDKEKHLFCVDETITLQNTIQVMQQNKIGSVIITQKNNHIAIITEKDIIKAVYTDVNMNHEVSRYMTTPLITISCNADVHDAIRIMQLKNIRRIVVTNHDEKVISILTNRDILQHIKGNYTKVLQNKIKHAQEIMNFLPEPIVEIYYRNNNAIISWLNSEAIKHFGKNYIDEEITCIIPFNDWGHIKKTIESQGNISNAMVKIGNLTYEISGTISKNISSSYIKLILKDITPYATKNQQLQDIIDKEITKRMESEYLLMQQAKLATMGEMIGHIAHQWRQPLSKLGGIFMNLESAYSFDELSENYLQERLEAGNQLIKYMSSTIDDFRNFFEPKNQKVTFIINEQIENALNIIKASLVYKHININFLNRKKLIKFTGYPNEFSQVILNIIANAEDAIVANKVLNGEITISIQETLKYVIITIKDNGGGISDNLLPKIFDIYFTTKNRKEGSGLGLYMSKLIIETKLNGTISVANIVHGAQFTIKLNR